MVHWPEISKIVLAFLVIITSLHVFSPQPTRESFHTYSTKTDLVKVTRNLQGANFYYQFCLDSIQILKNSFHVEPLPP